MLRRELRLSIWANVESPFRVWQCHAPKENCVRAALTQVSLYIFLPIQSSVLRSTSVCRARLPTLRSVRNKTAGLACGHSSMILVVGRHLEHILMFCPRKWNNFIRPTTKTNSETLRHTRMSKFITHRTVPSTWTMDPSREPSPKRIQLLALLGIPSAGAN